jgi:hypothetical protein
LPNNDNGVDLFDATDELRTIRAWARARYAAPSAVLGGVFLRVAASVGPEVQLPGLIGGRASLNLLAAFVSPSGGGKGISDKVARLVWPRPIVEKPIGSGEGIAATFTPPKKPDAEQIRAAIFSAGEIDTLAGLAGRQGSILLAQLKNMAMGELLGQSNASEATTRIVPAHSYRACLGVGAQPGHCDVIFNDTTGGTPQRFLWFNTVDPDMPGDRLPDPAPLNTAVPLWCPGPDGVVEIGYGPDEIAETVIAAHLARQRGQADALDGHALLTRCKVAAVLAIMHHRSVVSELDWQLSAQVMATSDRTRQWVLEQAAQAARAKVRDRAINRAVFDEIIDQRRLETVKRRVLKVLAGGGKPHHVLSAQMGRTEYRQLLPQALAELIAEDKVSAFDTERPGKRYELFRAEHLFRGEMPSSKPLNTVFSPEHLHVVPDPQIPTSRRTRPSVREWLETYRVDALKAGVQRVEPIAVVAAATAAGFSESAIRNAATYHPGVTPIRLGGTAMWSLIGETQLTAVEFVDTYLDQLSKETKTVDQDHFLAAADAAGIVRDTARKTMVRHPCIDSVPAHGNSKTERVWHILAEPAAGGGGAA